MFDFHMHSVVSYDGESTPEQIVQAAQAAGLKEICFTDHLDYELGKPKEELAFLVARYNAAYNGLQTGSLAVGYGAEIGMTDWNVEEVSRDLRLRHYDFVIGSVHHVKNLDMYFAPFWEGKTVLEAEREYFETVLQCVKLHDDFDVLGHLTYISKTRAHPTHELVKLETHEDVIREIMKVLVAKGKGMEINTSGVDRCGDFLPAAEYLWLFKELGGEIVTVGSDAHNAQRVGQYTREAARMAAEIFGHVCTFRDRKPVFHKL